MTTSGAPQIGRRLWGSGPCPACGRAHQREGEATSPGGGAWGARGDDLRGAYSCVAGPLCRKDLVILTTFGGPFVHTGKPTGTVKVGELGAGEDSPAPKVYKVKQAWFITTE